MDPVTTAVVGWATGQAGTMGLRGLNRFILGGKQQNALRAVVGEAISSTVEVVVDEGDRNVVREALLRESPDPADVRIKDILDLREAVLGQVGPRLEVLAEQGYVVYADRLAEVLAKRIGAGIQADAARGGALTPRAELLRHERVAAAGEEAAEQLRLVNRTLGRALAGLLPGPDPVGSQVGAFTVSAPAAVARAFPRETRSFTGREADLERLLRALADAAGRGGVVGIHAIDGMAGVGKTAFAVHAARQLVPRFPDGQRFVRLHAHTPGQTPTHPGDALGALLLSIGVSAEQIPADLEARTAMWRDRMSGLKVLVLLDDAVGHEQVRPLLPESAGSLVLITSRRRLAALDDAASISLDTLAPDDAARLFVRLAARPGLRPAHRAVADVVRLSGYLPLAIRLVAGRTATHPSWTLDDVAGNLATAESRLALMRAENISVAAAFNLSYRGLTTGQQHLFRRLGLHPGSDIDAYAAAALDGSDLATARRHLDELYDQHLIDEPANGRFRFHDLIREHARALASNDQPAQNNTAVHQLLKYYVRTAAVADRALREAISDTVQETGAANTAAIPIVSTYKSGLAWMEIERLNLAAVIGYAAAHGQSLVAAQLSHAISVFAQRRGYWAQTITVHQVALTGARNAGDLSSEAGILNDLAVLQSQAGEYMAAAQGLTHALRLYVESNDEAGHADTLHNLGVVQSLAGDDATAVTTLAQALGLSRRLGDHAGEAAILDSLGGVQLEADDVAGAFVSFEQALGLHSNLGSRRGQANALNGIGIIQQEREEYAPAAASLDRALGLYRDLDDPRGEATVFINIGRLQLETKEYAAATASWEKALSMWRELGSPLGQAKALYGMGLVGYRTGDHPAAITSWTEALGLIRGLGNRAFEARILSSLAKIPSASGA